MFRRVSVIVTLLMFVLSANCFAGGDGGGKPGDTGQSHRSSGDSIHICGGDGGGPK